MTHKQGPIHINAYPNQVCAYYLDKDKCVSFKIDPQLKKLFIVKSKKFLVKNSTILGIATMKDGSSVTVNAVNGQLLELHDVDQPKDEWQDYFALITSKKTLNLL